MTAESSPPTSRGFFRFGLADLLFVLFAAGILQRAGAGMLDDPGLGWQIRIPDAMLERGGFLYTDPFSATAQGEPWTPYGFLGSSAFRLAEAWAGLNGIAALTVLTLAFILRCQFRWMVADGVPPVQAVFWTLLVALGISSSWVARPNLFTLLLLPVTARVCIQWHRGRLSRGQLLWLVPLFLVWANTHGGFAAGLVTVAVAGVVELALACFGPADGRPAAEKRFRWLFLVGCACVLATLVNPYGPGLHRQVLKMTGDSYMMNLNDDWLSPDFHEKGAFRLELLILVLPVLLAGSRWRPDWVSLALSVFWLHMALNGRRYAPLWVLVTAPTLARLARETAALERIQAWFRRRAPALAAAPSPGRAAWFWTAVIAVTFLASSRFVRLPAGHNPEITPVAALDKLLELHRGERVFHSINWGGYLTWNGWKRDPRFLVWIDDRNEIYGRERTEEWREVSSTLPGWRERLERFGVGLVCVEADSGLAYRLPEVPGWREVYRDDWAVIFRRDAPADRGTRELAQGVSP